MGGGGHYDPLGPARANNSTNTHAGDNRMPKLGILRIC